MRTLRLALLNVSAMRRRYLGLALLVLVGTACVLALTSVTAGAGNVTRTRISEGVALRSVEVLPRVDLPQGARLTEQRVQQLATDPDVGSVEPTVQATVGIKTATIGGVLLHATVPRPSLAPPVTSSTRAELFPLAGDEVVLPEQAQGYDLRPLLGTTVRLDFQRTIGPGQGEGAHDQVRVVGLFDPSWQLEGPDAAFGGQQAVVRWAASVAGTPTDTFLATQGYDRAMVVARTSQAVPGLVQRLQAQAFGATSLQDELTQLPAVLRLLDTLSKVLVVALLFFIFVASLSLNTALVRQRTREIGLLKAIGFRDRAVFSTLLTETAVLGSVCVLWGLLLGAVSAGQLGRLLSRAPDLAPYLQSQVTPSLRAVLLVGAVPLVALVGGNVLPARRAARMEPVAALRDF